MLTPKDVRYRRIPPTLERVMKCKVKTLKARAALAGLPTSGGKCKLAEALVEYMEDNMPLDLVVSASTPTTTTPTTTTPTTTTPTIPTPTTTTPTNTHTTNTVTTNTNTTTPTTTSPATPTKWSVGDCLEVWWPELGEWFPCVVKHTQKDVDGSTVQLCQYESETKGRWHNLYDERVRGIPPTPTLLNRLTHRQLRDRLTMLHVPSNTGWRKQKLVSLIVAAVAAETDAAETDTTVAHTTTSRAKYAESHKQRRLRIKRRQKDREDASAEMLAHGDSKRKRHNVGVGRKRRRGNTVAGEETAHTQKRTTTQAVTEVGRHAQALYTLATTGSRRDDRQEERQGYNLLIFSQSDMCRWDPNSHVWKSGDRDMGQLHPHISRYYDTTGWFLFVYS